jgi:hypothetical protein
MKAAAPSASSRLHRGAGIVEGMVWRRLACAGLLCLGAAAAAAAPAPAPGAPGARLRVYLDCDDTCFADYVRDEVTFVDFVRQPQDADVHLLASSQETGGGGRETVLRFVGQGRFAGINQELRVLSISGDTENTRRALALRTIIVGLLGYVARDGLPATVTLDVETAEAAGAGAPARDPWNAWVFSIDTSADFSAEESNKERTWDFSVSADRVTEAWKISFGASLDHTTEEFDLDEDEPFKVTRRERSGSWFVARSLGPHWSAGLNGRIESSTFGNTELSIDTAPAIEFSVFPYREYATRELRLQYSIGAAHARYNEITLFDRLRETHGQHEFSINLDQQQPWGSLDASLEFSQYLHDLSKYRLEARAELNLRITRGLSFSIDGSASRIRDQLSLPRRDATPEEVLLRLRQLQSGYEVQFDVGFRYSFGSLFNNVVNPRFGR